MLIIWNFPKSISGRKRCLCGLETPD